MKRCCRCGFTKDISEFYSRKTSKDGLRSECKSCSRLQNVDYYAANADEQKEISRIWRKNNPEKARKSQKQWRIENAEKKKTRDRIYYFNNKEKIQARTSQYQKDNPEKVREWSRLSDIKHKTKRLFDDAFYRLLNPEKKSEANRKYAQSDNGKSKIRTNVERRRARLLSVVNTFDESQWQWLLKICDYKCLACGATKSVKYKSLEQDHIDPLDPGTHTLDNIQPLCDTCNSRKGRNYIDYRPEWIKVAVNVRMKELGLLG